ncbi:MAG: holo-ACP synthase [Thermoguttaceae bacterium]|nr:holo-ACP synthase [Thermoguttaceae bacterium]MDW8036817.1 holo-ACP synthase [Thermoguttaceae bacterium]
MGEIVGLGTEITECLRIARLIQRYGEAFLGRVFTPEEIRYCQSRRQSTEHFTARWAAKKAVLKALGLSWQPGFQWRDIELANDQDGQPMILLHGPLNQAARQMGIRQWKVALAYCRTHATATVIAIQ